MPSLAWPMGQPVTRPRAMNVDGGEPGLDGGAEAALVSRPLRGTLGAMLDERIHRDRLLTGAE